MLTKEGQSKILEEKSKNTQQDVILKYRINTPPILILFQYDQKKPNLTVQGPKLFDYRYTWNYFPVYSKFCHVWNATHVTTCESKYVHPSVF